MKIISLHHLSRKIAWLFVLIGVTVSITWFTLKRNFGLELSRPDTSVPVATRIKREHSSESLKTIKMGGDLGNSVDWTKCSLSINDTAKLAKASMTPDLARVLLERVKSETKNINERACVAAAIISMLCGKGYPEEAWELVEKNPGQLREYEIGAIFLSDPRPIDSLVKKLETLDDPNEKSEALRSLISSRPMEILNLDFSKISVDSSKEKTGLAVGILSAMKTSDSLGTPETTEALLKKAVKLLEEHKLDPGNLTSILNYDYSIDVSSKWKILGAIKDGIPPNEIERIYADAVPKLINSDLNKAMDLICSTPSTKYSVPIISRAITTMYETDPQQANDWVTTHLPSLDPGTGQRIVGRVAQVAIKNGEFETAQKWANQLVHPGVKQQVVEQINAAKQAQQAGSK